MTRETTASLPLVVLILIGTVADATGSDFSYAGVDAGSFDLCGAPVTHSRTEIWDSFVRASGLQIPLPGEASAGLTIQNLSHNALIAANRVHGDLLIPPVHSVGGQSWIRAAFRKLGGRELLGAEVRSEADFVEVVKRGVPIGALAELIRQEALSLDEVDRLIIARSTLAQRKAKNQQLSRVESERAIRVASLTALADDTFGSPGKARRWLRRPTSSLNDKRPIDLLDSEPGARVVEQLLYRIAHGIAA